MNLPPAARRESLLRIFKRDIENNESFAFRGRQIRPIKKEGQREMDILFDHLTHERVWEANDDGSKFKKKVFERNRSQRLHWILHHVEERAAGVVLVFSRVERDQQKRKDVTKTYIYDRGQRYVIVLEVQKSGMDYFLLSAHYLDRPGAVPEMEDKFSKKLPDVH